MSAFYAYEPIPPLIDHQHNRHHQHQTLGQFLTRQHPNPESQPNQPDVDLRESATEYIIEIEVPGIKNTDELHLHWTGEHSLVLLGKVERPEPTKTPPPEPAAESTEEKTAAPEAHPPILVVSERRVGPFRRLFTFPDYVEKDKLDAKLEAGLLKIRLPKRKILGVNANKVEVRS